MNPVYERLHPLTIVIELEKTVRRFLLLIAFFAFQIITSGKTGDTSELMFTALGSLTVIAAIVRYLNYGYAIHNGSLWVKEGLFQKKERQIPLDRIQNINVRRGWVHRILGLADLDIETAGGGSAEASLTALGHAEADELKLRLLGKTGLTSSFLESRRDDIIYSASPKELFLAGATENRALIIIGAIVGLFQFTRGSDDFLQKGLETVLKGYAGQAPPWMAITLGIAALLFVGWLLSIGFAFVNYWGFELTQQDGRLRRTYGLINQVENVVLIKRVQSVRLTQNIIQRWVKVGKLFVETAGSFSSGKGDDNNQGAPRATSLLTPVLEIDRAPSLIQRVLPGFEWSQLIYHRLPNSAFWVAVYRGLWGCVILSLLPAWWIKQWAFAVFGGLILLNFLSAWLRQKSAGWVDLEEHIVAASGAFRRVIEILPTRRVQSVVLTQSPAQRRFGLASVSVRTGAAAGSVVIEDIPLSEAEPLAYSLHRRSADIAMSNFDGL